MSCISQSLCWSSCSATPCFRRVFHERAARDTKKSLCTCRCYSRRNPIKYINRSWVKQIARPRPRCRNVVGYIFSLALGVPTQGFSAPPREKGDMLSWGETKDLRPISKQERRGQGGKRVTRLGCSVHSLCISPAKNMRHSSLQGRATSKLTSFALRQG